MGDIAQVEGGSLSDRGRACTPTPNTVMTECTQENDHLQSSILSHVAPLPFSLLQSWGGGGEGEGEGSSLWPMKPVRQKKRMLNRWKEIGLSGTGKWEKLQKVPEAEYDRGQSAIGRWAVGNN
jgi:hypothetical protein